MAQWLSDNKASAITGATLNSQTTQESLYPSHQDEVIEHVMELALWDHTTTVADTVERAFDEFETFEVPVTIDVLGALYTAVFGSPRDARENHLDMTDRMLEILYPGITGKLLSWYITC